jgi:methyltransferase
MRWAWFAGLCGLVTVERLGELRWSRAHLSRAASRGGRAVREPWFAVMAVLHGAVLVGAPLEAWLRRASPPRAGTGIALATLAAATALRIWTLGALGDAWSVRVTRFPAGARRVVTTGPYRYIRHPNYVAVILELAALPLAGGAIVTAIVATLANALVLARRIPLEERELATDPGYLRAMAHKPRFLPLPGSARSG